MVLRYDELKKTDRIDEMFNRRVQALGLSVHRNA
jgi:hypothetical protein